MFACVADFLSNRNLKVRNGSEFSSSYPQEEGVPQGSVFSTTFFDISINPLLECVPLGVQASAYADDFAVYCSGSTALECGQKIQEAINYAHNCVCQRGLRFSVTKTKAIRFSRL